MCLGGQLLAHALGGRVERMPRRMVEWTEVRRLPFRVNLVKQMGLVTS